MKRYAVPIVGLVVLVLLMASQVVFAGDPRVEFFRISPSGSVQQGTVLSLHGKVTDVSPRACRFRVGGSVFYELGTPEINATYNTSNLGQGNHRFYFECALGGDWSNVLSASQTINVTARSGGGGGNNPAPTTGGTNIDGYCKAQGYDRGRCPGDGFSCRCAGGNRETEIDMYALCEWQYNGQLPHPGLSDFFNPSTWTCNAQPAYVAQRPATPVPPPSNNGGSNNSGGSSSGSGGNSGSSGSSSGGSIPYTNAQVGDRVEVVNSPSNNALLCKSSAERGTHNVIGRVTNGDQMTITAGPWESNGLYFVRVTGACNGYVATGVSGERWIRRISSGSSGGSSTGSNSGSGSSSGSGSNNNQPAACQRGDRVSVGDRARIEPQPPVANILRAGSSQSSADIGRIQPGEEFDVIGGPVCNGRYKMWQVRTNSGQTGWTAEGDSDTYWIGRVSSGGQGRSGNSAVITHEIHYDEWNMTFPFQINTRTCAIVNGSQIVAIELQSLVDWNPSLPAAVGYFSPAIGGLEQFRRYVETELQEVSGCRSVYYLVGNLYMDMSGLGNVEFGFYSIWYSIALEDLISNAEQGINPRSWFQRYDNPDDVTQRRTGRAIAEELKNGRRLSSDLVERIAEEQNLQ